MTAVLDNDIHGRFAELLTRSLRSVRLPLSNEKETQAVISAVLWRSELTHEREYRLSPKDIADFWIPLGDGRGAVIEVKRNYQRPPEVMRQLERYAAHERVAALFLLSNKAMRLPDSLNEKPVHFVSMGQAWM